MTDIRIISSASIGAARNNARGHLFEKLMASVLRTYGYEIDRIPSVNYAGMEIDIEGHDLLNGIPMYAECKCYDKPVDSPSVQAFYGKYMARWRKDNRSRGLLVAIPSLNSHAKGFYRDNCEGATDITLSLLEQEAVVKAVLDAGLAVRPDALAKMVPVTIGTPGDQALLYTDHGIIWVQYILPVGGAIPDRYALITASGQPVTDAQTTEYVQSTLPELSGFKLQALASADPGREAQPLRPDEADQIVEVRGSSAWFEYQFPASPEFFVGRAGILTEVQTFVAELLEGKTSARGLLFTGNSGWGKSSVVLAAAAHLRQLGHFAIVVDCRSLSSPRSVLRVVDIALQKLYAEQGDLFRTAVSRITGFDGAGDALLTASKDLGAAGRLAFIFLDQFENLFFLPEALRRIRDLLLSMCDMHASVVFGFAWKTDLVGVMSDFPFELRDSIASACKRVALDTFSDVETNALLDKLRVELRTQIRKDLRFFLSEFSQGFPWLLKKLCAHVKAQRDAGVAQSEIANRLLNVDQLFREDLAGLSSEQESTLRRISKSAPVEISELSEHYSPAVVQSLVDCRLVVRIGNKYDIYWDIFRDYLNSNLVPVQENYLLRLQVGTVLKAMASLIRAGGRMSLTSFQEHSKLSEHSAMNVARDLRLLGLVTSEAGHLSSTISARLSPAGSKDVALLAAVRAHVKGRLVHNRLVYRLIAELKAENSLSLVGIGLRLAQWCPYVTATSDTWRMYARILATWMDLADLATFNGRTSTLLYYEPSTELRVRDLTSSRSRLTGANVPLIQYSPVENVLRLISNGLHGKQPIDWRGLKTSTVSKSMAFLEDLGFLSRTDRGYRANPVLIALPDDAEKRRAALADAVSKIPAFVKFTTLLDEHSAKGRSQLLLGRELRERLGVEWKDGTAQVNVKIMLDWARHAGLAPGVFARHPRKRQSKGPAEIRGQTERSQ